MTRRHAFNRPRAAGYDIFSWPQMPASSRLLQTLWPRMQHYTNIGKTDPLFAICDDASTGNESAAAVCTRAAPPPVMQFSPWCFLGVYRSTTRITSNHPPCRSSKLEGVKLYGQTQVCMDQWHARIPAMQAKLQEIRLALWKALPNEDAEVRPNIGVSIYETPMRPNANYASIFRSTRASLNCMIIYSSLIIFCLWPAGQTVLRKLLV